MVAQLSVSPNIPIGTLLSEFGPDLAFGTELAAFTGYNCGGKARFFMSVFSSDALIRATLASRKLGLPYVVLGGGTNVLISDEGFDGLVLKIDTQGMDLISSTDIRSGASEPLSGLLKFAARNSLSGLEFAAGIPGSVGGAIYGNAGAYGGSIGQVIKRVTVVAREGRVKELERDDCRFEYRDSIFKESGDVIIEAVVGLKQGDSAGIEEEMNRIMATRESKLPVHEHSAGCFFKNVPDDSAPHGKIAAGQLLEQAGAKDLRVGDAVVSDKHANIIVNCGQATSKDISCLADKMKEKVQEMFGISLEEEVVRIGKF